MKDAARRFSFIICVTDLLRLLGADTKKPPAEIEEAGSLLQRYRRERIIPLTKQEF